MQRDLVVRAQAGDLEAFSELTAATTNRLYAAARLILRHDERAADAVQDALIQALGGTIEGRVVAPASPDSRASRTPVGRRCGTLRP